MLFSIVLELGLNFGYPALGFVWVNFSRFPFPLNLIEKSFKKGFHKPPLHAQIGRNKRESLGRFLQRGIP